MQNGMNTGEHDEESATRRLRELIGLSDCLSFAARSPLVGHKNRWISMYGISETGEVIVELVDGEATRLRSFISRHKCCPPGIRRRDLPLVDIVDAFALARKMIKLRPRKPKRAQSGGDY